MKKLLFILVIIVSMSACGTYTSFSSLDEIQVGMTKQQVEYRIGRPVAVISVQRTPDGLFEALEYQTRYNEILALEFWNNHLVNFEVLYDGYYHNYIPPRYPPAFLPPSGRPIIIVKPGYNRPNRPYPKPEKPWGEQNRPRPPKPGYPDRPTTTRPDGNSSVRPPSNNRPTTPTPAERPSTTRPVERPANSGSTTTRPTTTRPATTREATGKNDGSTTVYTRPNNTDSSSRSSSRESTTESNSSQNNSDNSTTGSSRSSTRK